MKKNLIVSAVAAIFWLLNGCAESKEKTGGGPPAFQVVAVEAVRQPVVETLSLPGTAAANEMVEIKPEIDGVVEEIVFREGQIVEKGDLLLTLDASKLEAGVAEAEANYNLSKATFERAKELISGQLISPQEYDQAASTFALNAATLDLKRRQLKDTKIYAPFSGIVSARNASPGQVITKNTVVTWLVDVQPIKVEFNVPERVVSQLEIGQKVEISVTAYPDVRFQGTVFFISPYVDPETRTLLIKAEVPNPEYRLRPGMFASLDLTLRVREDAIVIPEAAVHQILPDDRASVYVVNEQTAELRSVTLGTRMPGKVEIVKGIQSGELVVVEGAQKLAPGSKVKLGPAKAAIPYTTTAPDGARPAS